VLQRSKSLPHVVELAEGGIKPVLIRGISGFLQRIALAALVAVDDEQNREEAESNERAEDHSRVRGNVPCEAVDRGSRVCSGTNARACRGLEFYDSRFCAHSLDAVGRNAEGQLGNGSTTSSTSLVKVGTLANVTDFSVGQTSAAAITDGQLWAWGWNGSAPVTTPKRVGTGTGFTQVVVGDIHSLAIGPGGEIYSWGDSSFGALGRSGSAATPAVVMRP